MYNINFDIAKGLTFDDVLLRPRYSDIESRSAIDISVRLEKPKEPPSKYQSYLFDAHLEHPIVPANMQSIVGLEMARALYLSGGLAIIHRFMPVEEQLAIPVQLEKEYGRLIWNNIGLSIGVKPIDRETADHFIANGVEIICIDIAHGHSKGCIDMCKYIRSKYPEVFLIAGNIATYDGALDLWEAGADAVKAGIGSGALCSTRIETGNGVPQMLAIAEAAFARYHINDTKLALYRANQYDNGEYAYLDATPNRPRYIIADGGIRNAGDCVKSLAIGADLVMCGNVFAGTYETPGEIVEIDGKQYKRYVGSSTHKTSHIEGVEALVPVKGKAEKVLQKLLEGIKSGCSYQGAHNLAELREHPEFIEISQSGLIESHPHNVRVI